MSRNTMDPAARVDESGVTTVCGRGLPSLQSMTTQLAIPHLHISEDLSIVCSET
jgi:hypothetical protein